MEIKSISDTIGLDITLKLYAQDEVGSVTWSVESGGGTITASGEYTAPSEPGIVTIKAVDDDANEATFNINVLTPIQLCADIIKFEMGLDADQVHIYNQKFDIPRDRRLYVYLGIFTDAIFGIKNVHSPNDAGLESVQVVNMIASIEANIMSAGFDALHRKEEIVMALNSDYSRRQQEVNSFKIANIAEPYKSLSELEESVIPYRYQTQFNIQYFRIKRNQVPYYDSFSDADVTKEP